GTMRASLDPASYRSGSASRTVLLACYEYFCNLQRYRKISQSQSVGVSDLRYVYPIPGYLSENAWLRLTNLRHDSRESKPGCGISLMIRAELCAKTCRGIAIDC